MKRPAPPRTSLRLLGLVNPVSLARLAAVAITAAALFALSGLPGLAPAAQAASGTAKPGAGAALAQKHGCLGCHAAQAQLAGPAYEAVAQKYAGESGAAEALAQRIREGGSGRWGPMPMPPQPQLSPADAKRLATWILAGAK